MPFAAQVSEYRDLWHQASTRGAGKSHMVLDYRGRTFRYESSFDDVFVGRLLLDNDERAWLERMDAENDCWYLDDRGERLPPDQLFEASPWSWESPSGIVKLMQRVFDHETGETRFSTPETYLGELYDWVRNKD